MALGNFSRRGQRREAFFTSRFAASHGFAGVVARTAASGKTAEPKIKKRERNMDIQFGNRQLVSSRRRRDRPGPGGLGDRGTTPRGEAICHCEPSQAFAALGKFLATLDVGDFVSASLALLAIALIDIRWGKIWREVPQKGIEVMFVLDVSRSMLAEDASPNRLTRAKQQIKDMVDEMAGDRVGLVAFAGEQRANQFH